MSFFLLAFICCVGLYSGTESAPVAMSPLIRPMPRPLPILPGKKCFRMCSRITNPVCDSLGKTHGNRCTFRIAKCENPELRIKHAGRCKGGLVMDKCVRPCIRLLDPVCDDRGETHGNECEFKIAQCQNPGLTMMHRGRCYPDPNEGNVKGPIIDPGFVGPIIDPGFGVGGGTNTCDHPCPRIMSPVCDNYGKRHANTCAFGIEQCKNPELKMTKSTGCLQGTAMWSGK